MMSVEKLVQESVGKIKFLAEDRLRKKITNEMLLDIWDETQDDYSSLRLHHGIVREVGYLQGMADGLNITVGELLDECLEG